MRSRVVAAVCRLRPDGEHRRCLHSLGRPGPSEAAGPSVAVVAGRAATVGRSRTGPVAVVAHEAATAVFGVAAHVLVAGGHGGAGRAAHGATRVANRFSGVAGGAACTVGGGLRPGNPPKAAAAMATISFLCACMDGSGSNERQREAGLTFAKHCKFHLSGAASDSICRRSLALEQAMLVEYWLWRYTDPMSGTPHTTDKHMTADEIATKYPRAQRVPGSVVYRDVQSGRSFGRSRKFHKGDGFETGIS